LRKSRNHYHDRCQDLVALLRTAETEHAELVQRVSFRPGLRNVSVMGGYTLALNMMRGGLVSASSTLAMCAGGSLQGALKSKRIVYIYENRPNAVQACQSILNYQDMDADALAVAHPPNVSASADSSAPFAFNWRMESTLFKGDATNQEAIGMDKVHIASVATVSFGPMAVAEAIRNDGTFDDSRFAPPRTHASCDLHIVRTGTGEETYIIVKDEMKSVGCPTWDDKVAAAALNPNLLSHFGFGLDNGPDNGSLAKRVKRALRDVLTVVFSVIWCKLHQTSLILGTIMVTLDKWEWPGEGAFESKYFGGVATITNVIRSHGAKRKV
jgi:hypothetical protein